MMPFFGLLLHMLAWVTDNSTVSTLGRTNVLCGRSFSDWGNWRMATHEELVVLFAALVTLFVCWSHFRVFTPRYVLQSMCWHNNYCGLSSSAYW